VFPFFQHEPDIEINPDAKRIYLAGGEPFMIKSFSRLLETIDNKECEIVINTN
jgi:organic radical activating enzyme